ncbi:MAG: DNA methyltransferase [candidate division WOR-3 bacterium]
MKSIAKSNLAKLVEKFEYELTAGKIKEYNEEATKTAFIQPLLKDVLGWDVTNRDEVSPEEKISRGRVDYGLKVEGKIKVFVEAKPPRADLNKHIEQAVRYGYNRKGVPFVLLTDFEELKLFDVTVKPDTRNPRKGLKIDLRWNDYLKEFDKLWLLSKESVIRGELDKLLLVKPKDRLPVDKAILDDLKRWRESLAKDIFKNNRSKITDAEMLKEITQRILDRIIFIRSCEDRGLVHRRPLKELFEERTETVGLNTMVFLKEEFKHYNIIFDSDLFRPQDWESDLAIDFKVMKEIVLDTYNPYQFDVIPLEVLGNIYEQYLGYTIRLTDHQVKYELKPDVRKAGGVYYTPEYIVDYIVKNTVGKLLQELPPAKIKKLRILDPACGSGSFLIRAYEEMLNYYKNQKRMQSHAELVSASHKTLKRVQGDEQSEEATQKRLDLKYEEAEPRLTIEEKSQILREHIFGVDIDEQAVEVTKLSLMLKMLEGEFGIIPGRSILPMLDKNIRCGNSLISGSPLELKKYFGDDWYKVKPFNWEEEFRKIMVEEGGFDVVIGNPPYGGQLTEGERRYLEEVFKIGTTDTAALMIYRVIKDLLHKPGMFSFIVPKPLSYASNWASIRTLLLPELQELVDCSKVWKEVKLEQVIFIYYKGKPSSKYISSVRRNEKIINVGKIEKTLCHKFGFILNGISEAELKISQKILLTGLFLNDFVINQRGGMLQKHVSSAGKISVLGGKQIQRYGFKITPKGKITKENVIDSKAWIEPNSILVQNIVAHIQNPFDHIQIISCPAKILDTKSFVILDTINQLINKSHLSSNYLTALLNSKLISWYVYRFIFAKAIRTMHFDSPVTSRIPIRNIDFSNHKDKKLHDDLVALVDVMLDLNKKLQTAQGSQKAQIQRQIEKTDKEIDEIVYKLYNITDDERKIIEGSVETG